MTLLAPKVILCIDDDKPCLELRKWVLEKQGYKVLVASDAAEGLELFSKTPIDLVILDYLLIGTTGAEVAATMKKIKPYVKIALLTGLPEIPEGIGLVDALLSKADSPAETLAKIALLLRPYIQVVAAS